MNRAHYHRKGVPIDETALSDLNSGLCGEKEPALDAIAPDIATVFGVHLDYDEDYTSHEPITSKHTTLTEQRGYVCEKDGESHYLQVTGWYFSNGFFPL